MKNLDRCRYSVTGSISGTDLTGPPPPPLTDVIETLVTTHYRRGRHACEIEVQCGNSMIPRLTIAEAGSLRKREKPVTGYEHRIPASIFSAGTDPYASTWVAVRNT
jgi:hypothetical protein